MFMEIFYRSDFGHAYQISDIERIQNLVLYTSSHRVFCLRIAYISSLQNSDTCGRVK